MNAKALLTAIEHVVCAYGGDVRIGATDPFHPERGTEAEIRVMVKGGDEIHFFGTAGQDGTAEEALTDAVQKMLEVIPIPLK